MENTRQTKLIRVLAFIFTVIGANGIYMSISNNNTKLGIISFAILTVCGFSFWYLGKSREDRKEPDAFLVQLLANRESIVTGGWKYKDKLVIEPETVLTQYIFTFSLITLSFKMPSRFYIAGQENTGLVNFVYTSLNLLLGWWGIPWGPIYTIQSLVNNLKGGNQITVESVLKSA
jgi:hypothetical protein